VLLPQIPYDVVDNRGRRGLLLGFKGVPGLCASPGDLAGAADPEPLNLLWGQAELERQLRVLGPFGEARMQSIALISPEDMLVRPGDRRMGSRLGASRCTRRALLNDMALQIWLHCVMWLYCVAQRSPIF